MKGGADMDIYTIHKADGSILHLTRDELIQNARDQKADGVKPSYSFWDYKRNEAITPPGWLVYSTYEDGAGVVYPIQGDADHMGFVRGWQGEFCMI